MDYKEFLSFAPKDCQKVITTITTSPEGMLEEAAQKLFQKPVKELTEDELKKSQELVESQKLALNDPIDAYRE